MRINGKQRQPDSCLLFLMVKASKASMIRSIMVEEYHRLKVQRRCF